MRLKVMAYHTTDDTFACRAENGNPHRVDLVVDGGIQKEYPEFANNHQWLVGKTVTIETLIPYLELGQYVKVEEPPAQHPLAEKTIQQIAKTEALMANDPDLAGEVGPTDGHSEDDK